MDFVLIGIPLSCLAVWGVYKLCSGIEEKSIPFTIYDHLKNTFNVLFIATTLIAFLCVVIITVNLAPFILDASTILILLFALALCIFGLIINHFFCFIGFTLYLAYLYINGSKHILAFYQSKYQLEFTDAHHETSLLFFALMFVWAFSLAFGVLSIFCTVIIVLMVIFFLYVSVDIYRLKEDDPLLLSVKMQIRVLGEKNIIKALDYMMQKYHDEIKNEIHKHDVPFEVNKFVYNLGFSIEFTRELREKWYNIYIDEILKFNRATLEKDNLEDLVLKQGIDLLRISLLYKIGKVDYSIGKNFYEAAVYHFEFLEGKNVNQKTNTEAFKILEKLLHSIDQDINLIEELSKFYILYDEWGEMISKYRPQRIDSLRILRELYPHEANALLLKFYSMKNYSHKEQQSYKTDRILKNIKEWRNSILTKEDITKSINQLTS